MKKFFEAVKVAEVVDSTDIHGAGVTSGYHSVALFRRIAAFLKTGTVAEAKTATITLLQATSAAGAGAKALKAVVSPAAGVGGQVFMLEVEADASELDLAGGFAYVAVKIESNDAVAVTGAAALLLTEARFEPV